MLLQDNDNLHIMPGEIALAYKEGNLYTLTGAPNERGFTSFAGFRWDRYASDESAMRRLYCLGVVKTEYFVNDIAALQSRVPITAPHGPQLRSGGNLEASSLCPI